MSFDNYYPNRKDHRKAYGLPKRIDRTCRNGGKCSRCRGNRMYSTNKWKMAAMDQLLDDGGSADAADPTRRDPEADGGA